MEPTTAAGFEWCPCCRLQPATLAPLNPAAPNLQRTMN